MAVRATSGPRGKRSSGRPGANSNNGAGTSVGNGGANSSTSLFNTDTVAAAAIFKEIKGFYYSDNSDTEINNAVVKSKEMAKYQSMFSTKFCCGCSFPVKSEIYSCRNGHYVCKTCSFEKRCPDCRVLFKRGLYRNVGLETLLTERTDCPFKNKGCNERIIKIALSKHIIVCRFSYVGYQLCNLVGYKECEFAGCPLKITEFVEHMMLTHDGRFYAGAGIDRIVGVKAILKESLEKHELFMWDMTILSADDDPERDLNGNLLPSRQNYFMVCGGCNSDIFFYTCIHMGPGAAKKVKDFEITVQILSRSATVPHFEIKPKVLDISIAGCLNGWSETFEFPLEHSLDNYLNSEGELTEVVWVSRRHREKIAAPKAVASATPKGFLKSVETQILEIDSSEYESDSADTVIIPGKKDDQESRPDSPGTDLSDPPDYAELALDSPDQDGSYDEDDDSSNWETDDDSGTPPDDT